MRLTGFTTEIDEPFPANSSASGNAGPSNITANGSNRHTLANTNGVSPFTSNGLKKLNNARKAVDGPSVTKVLLPGTTLFEGSNVDREEFVRVVIQSLRDIGYSESAVTLEAESGYVMESPEVAEFRQCIIEGSWDDAKSILLHLASSVGEKLWEAEFLISQQKYLELLEAQATTEGLHVLRDELAPYVADSNYLDLLSSYMMCTGPVDLRILSGWDGAAGHSRYRLLENIQQYIPPSLMLPRHRLPTLLNQARSNQIRQCLYHNAPTDALSWSLYKDHQCNKAIFPRTTTIILQMHTDEVWSIEWSHDGKYLASAGKDKVAIIWRIGPEKDPMIRECVARHRLEGHKYAVGCLAWSTDDLVLLTSSDSVIRMWDATHGELIKDLDAHTETVSSLVWLPDNSGFISGGLDRRIIRWTAVGVQLEAWGQTSIRITDLAITPDFTRLVAVGINHQLGPIDLVLPRPGSRDSSISSGPSMVDPAGDVRSSTNRLIVYNMLNKQIELSIPLEGDPSSVKISRDSQFALINHAPDEIQLWNIRTGDQQRKYNGQRQGQDIIRSCFGGADCNFVVSGSEDGKVYIWQLDTGVLLEVLEGHGAGNVNTVAWHPTNEQMFASASDDGTIRIWETMPSEEEDSFPSSFSVFSAPSIEKGKGKIRHPWPGANTDGAIF